MRAGWWALCGAATCAAGCGLDKNGLMAEPFSDDGGPVGADAALDGTSSGEGSSGGDAASGDATGVDGSPLDAGSGDGDFFDVPPQPPDASPAPVVYDGGALGDPTFDGPSWVGFCVDLTACLNAGSISSCLGRRRQPGDPEALFPPPSVVACIANYHDDCANIVSSCLEASGTCSPQAPESCTGNRWNNCRLGVPMAFDCGDLGMVCSEGIGNAGCGFGDCYAWQEGQSLCVGQYVVQCHHGRYEPQEDCAVFGSTCGNAPAECLAKPSCQNVDCNQLFGGGYKCTTDPSGAPRCSLGAQCASTQIDTCDTPGHQAQFCNAGIPAQFDCHGAGWANDCKNGKCAP